MGPGGSGCEPKSVSPPLPRGLPASHLLRSWEPMLLPSGKGKDPWERAQGLLVPVSALAGGKSAVRVRGRGAGRGPGNNAGLGGRYSSGESGEHEAEMKYARETRRRRDPGPPLPSVTLIR